MGTPLLMPSLSPTMEQGTIATWLVKPGDRIEQGTPLCSIETDKTTVDYESLDEGFLREILQLEGSMVPVNQLIAFISDEQDEDYKDELAAAQAESDRISVPQTESSPQPKREVVQEIPEEKIPTAASVPSDEKSIRQKISPLARKIAAEKGIDLSLLQGSGPRGRIVRADVENFTPSPTPQKNPIASAPSAVTPVLSESRDVPLSKVRKVIGNRLLASHQGAPSFFVTIKMNAEKILSLREEINAVSEQRISVNDLLLKCVSSALRKHPTVNSTFHGDFVREHAEVDISVAVSVENGLITPIVRGVQNLGLAAISGEMKSLSQKAREGNLSPEEYQGGTFTISNMGMFGISQFTSIINPPQTAILAIAGIEEVLQRNAVGEIVNQRVMQMTLTSDHRVIDGAEAARFMNTLKVAVENPASLLL